MHRYEMTRGNLNKVMDEFAFASHTREALRRVFLRGMTYEEAGWDWSLSKQYLWTRVHKVLRKAEEMGVKVGRRVDPT